MTEHRLHPFAALRVLRKTLVLYLVPLLRVLFERNWAALQAALRQDLILFLLVCALSWVILHASSWSLDESGTFCLHWKLLFWFDRTVRGASLAALTIERPFYYRLAGASRVTLYPVGEPKQRTLTLCLRRADAQHLADQLLPIEAPSLHRPKGGERAALGLLGANSLSTLALFLLAIRQTQQGPDRYELAFAQINFLAGLAARWLPAGAAWLLAFSGFLLGLSLLRSFVQTVHYEVWHTSTQIGSRGGWLDRFECRVKSDQISFADVRLSPFARLMRRWPVFVTAGSCSPELPLFVLPFRGGSALPGASARISDAAGPSGPDRTAQSHLFCSRRSTLCPLRPAHPHLPLHPARPDRDPAVPHPFLCGGAGGRRDGLPAGGGLAAGGASDPAAAAGHLSAQHLRLPSGHLPDGPAVALGRQCRPHQSDRRLPRFCPADGAQHPVAGRTEMF